ncbi:MAG: hypothetical protein QNL04_07985 [SAR324 cluster bacterium]|nr:hypothetical protein [SAR324 cluster bacterium]
MAVETQTIADAMLAMVVEAAGKKRYKPGDLSKAMIKQFGEDVSKRDCKDAIRILVDGEKLVYTYFNGTWLEIPHEEGSAKS